MIHFSVTVVHAIVGKGEKIAGLFRFLDPSLSLPSDVTPFFIFFLPLLLKGPNSQVAQIPHCAGWKGRKAKKRVREESNPIQLKATII